MKGLYYFGGTFSLYILEVLLALVIDDIGILFEFVSAFSVCALTFILPGVLYIIADNNYGSYYHDDSRYKKRKYSWFFIIFGCCAFCILVARNILNIMSVWI